ncbi:MAG TPA: hypothetical protein VFW73_02610 [Lacipirellulaceae bacterium]|nr:hypothetical protein [Lacipirellulaceae bacterium]
MASDPRFGVEGTRFDESSNQYDESTPRRRSVWTTCLFGCLAVLALLVVFGVIVGIWFSRHWRGWFAEFGSQAIEQGIDASELPQQEKMQVKAQVDRVANDFRDGKISPQQMATIMQKLTQSPLMPSLVVAAVDKRYFDRSGLSNDEKAEGRTALNRFARGMIDGKINQQGVDSVMSHVANRKADGKWQLRSQVSDQDLRAAISAAKSQADAAGISQQPPVVDPSDEIKRIIDETLQEHHGE